MKIGFLSDAHGNPLALRRCLALLQNMGVERVYFLGDAVGYLPGEVEVLAILREHGVNCQKGNHEAMLLGDLGIAADRAAVYRLDDAKARLGPAGCSELQSWPTSRNLDESGRRLLLVHGSPADPLAGYVYPDSSLDEIADVDLVLLGNTHRPFTSRAGQTTFVNVGSCGLPRDRGDLLSFAVYDVSLDKATVYRTHLDPARVLAQFGGGAIPDAVKDVLARRPSGPVFGEVVPETA